MPSFVQPFCGGEYLSMLYTSNHTRHILCKEQETKAISITRPPCSFTIYKDHSHYESSIFIFHEMNKLIMITNNFSILNILH